MNNSYHHVSARCLRRDREKRFGSAADVKRAVLKEPARKAKNSAAVFTIVLSFIFAGWLLWNGEASDIPAAEPETKPTAASDTLASPEIDISDRYVNVPVQEPDSKTATTPEPIKTTPKDSQFNSGENLDADALDDMFKDAAEQIL